MYRFIAVCLICLSASSGCIKVSPGRAADAPTRKDGPSPVAAKPAHQPKGIEIKQIYGFTIKAGDPDGTPLSERVDAVHLCSGDSTLTISYGSPKHGVIKAYGYDAMNAHMRYYPPDVPCEDSVPVEIRAEDGCFAEGTIVIRVVSDQPEKPAENRETAPREPAEPNSDASFDDMPDRDPSGFHEASIKARPVVGRTALAIVREPERSASAAPRDEVYYNVVALVF
jgi:hypothetical protein